MKKVLAIIWMTAAFSFAGITFHPQYITLHLEDGNIHFKNDEGWVYKYNFPSGSIDDAAKLIYSTLLTAKSTGKKVTVWTTNNNEANGGGVIDIIRLAEN